MSSEDERAIYEAIRAARRKARGYADFFGWATDRDLEEQSVAGHLAESLKASDALFFSQIKIRGRGKDPPDLEAIDLQGRLMAIEITELVDGKAIEAYKAGRYYDWAEWDRTKFISSLTDLLLAKDARFDSLKGGPYPGGYLVIVFSDEPELQSSMVENFLSNYVFPRLASVTKAILLLSYEPGKGGCPYFELV